MNDIKEALQPEVKEVLSEESLTKIEQHVNTKVGLHVEKALVKQDEEYSVALEKFLQALDADHSAKLKKVVEAIEINHVGKLKKVIQKYEKALNEEAEGFRQTLVSRLSKYIDLYLEKAVPQEAIEEAVRNKRSEMVLQSVRKVLGVDLALAKESIREAVMDGKSQINEAQTELESVKQQLAELQKENGLLKAKYFLEQKVTSLPEDKRGYVKKILGNKSYEFIKENYDYTVSMFDKKEEEKLQALTEQAKQEATSAKVDRVVVEEKTQPTQPTQDNPVATVYLSELQKYK